MDLDERGARRTTHLIEATYVAYGDARARVKAHENQRSGGLGVEGEAQALLSSGKDPKIVHVCRTTFGLDKAKSDTSRIHEGELCRGKSSFERTTSKHLGKANC